MHVPKYIRNLAIVAHIDHGKTTLLDGLLLCGHLFRHHEPPPKRAMDYYDLEKERGITIFAKHTSLYFDPYKINMIDTPGHADFAGEIERVLGMVNAVLLVVDAQEGPMPQTRFVLSKSLNMGLAPIVVLNKVDRSHADPDRVLTETFDLFVELGANDVQLDFPYCYASALKGYAFREGEAEREGMQPLIDLIIEKVSPPQGHLDRPFLMQAMTLSHHPFLGRQATGRILEGKVGKGELITLMASDGSRSQHRISHIDGYRGLDRVEMDQAGAGDIVSLSGVPEVRIGDTLCDPSSSFQLPPIILGAPTLSIDVLVNSGPMGGREGKHVTMSKIRDRFRQEKRSNISLCIEEIEGKEESIRVSGRGELHLSILIETIRREGYECLLSRPHVVLQEGKEPMESVYIEIPEEFSGMIVQDLNRRRGEIVELSTNAHQMTKIKGLLPTRSLIGYRGEFMTKTKGVGILTSIFDSYAHLKGEIPGRQNGVLVSMTRGKVTGYACFHLRSRGTLFVDPTDEVYEGMIVGEHRRGQDLVVNVTKEKPLTNVRAAGHDEAILLSPPRKFTLEQAIDYIQEDEYVEVTPSAIRLRKKKCRECERRADRRRV